MAPSPVRTRRQVIPPGRLDSKNYVASYRKTVAAYQDQLAAQEAGRPCRREESGRGHAPRLAARRRLTRHPHSSAPRLRAA
ncbi:hypothetical protein [Streptomyces sp. NBC_01320]|uniref:hypothetical protein n=1 Tax=Streptomyces sp. NBC_01320 TaxID=2903824 RepID=UPI002E105EAD|nr:hypothetical protein OG395_01575 [Streptomyces sp. NBC_01320]WSK00984.1 hypothetical protein OG395_53775 [Streptomyces sp. NBC_01320]